jgi:hypothetical protein
MTEAAFRRHSGRAALSVLAAGVVGGMALGAVGQPAAGLGVALGAGAGAAALRLHAGDLLAQARLDGAAAGRRDRLGRLGRLAIRGGALAVAVLRPEVSVVGTAAGLFLAPAVLVALELGGRRAAPG